MFIGHTAVAFASKRAAPRASLGVLMAAVMFVDLIWPIFLLLGVEHVKIARGITRFSPLDFSDYPWSHSLVMAIGWSILFAIVYWAVSRYGRGAIVAGACVFSHWLLDLIVHRADLPILPGNAGGLPLLGFGLWRVPGVAAELEFAIVAAGAWLYWRAASEVARGRAPAGFWRQPGALAASIFVAGVVTLAVDLFVA